MRSPWCRHRPTGTCGPPDVNLFLFLVSASCSALQHAAEKTWKPLRTPTPRAGGIHPRCRARTKRNPRNASLPPRLPGARAVAGGVPRTDGTLGPYGTLLEACFRGSERTSSLASAHAGGSWESGVTPPTLLGRQPWPPCAESTASLADSALARKNQEARGLRPTRDTAAVPAELRHAAQEVAMKL